MDNEKEQPATQPAAEAPCPPVVYQTPGVEMPPPDPDDPNETFLSGYTPPVSFLDDLSL